MSRSILLAGIAAAVLAMPAAAKPNGWYVGLAGGVSEVEPTILFTGPLAGPLAPTHKAEFDTGWVGMLTAGYRWQSGWRLELEGGYRSNDGVQRTLPAGPIAAFDMEELTAMGNVIYDFPLTDKWTLSFGAGLGADFVKGTNGFSGNELDDTVLAGQLIAQIGYEVTSRLELFADYHYLVAEEPELIDGPTKATFEIDKHAALIGLRYDLQADAAPYVPPPPPPAAPPPPPPMKEFVVFFGFNKYNLTADAQSVVAEAAAQAKSQGAASIRVVGHTDTSGSARYNQVLSEKRAKTVADELVRQGIAPSAISASGRGENELLVQTGDGVKEPQNRRATINLQ